VSIRAIRGATRLTADDSAEMNEAVIELLQVMLERNGITVGDVISVLLTATPDLRCAFPAAAARAAGFGAVPLLCAQEIDVAGAPERIVRVLAHASVERPQSEVSHVYLRGAEILRQDLAQ